MVCPNMYFVQVDGQTDHQKHEFNGQFLKMELRQNANFRILCLHLFTMFTSELYVLMLWPLWQSARRRMGFAMIATGLRSIGNILTGCHRVKLQVSKKMSNGFSYISSRSPSNNLLFKRVDGFERKCYCSSSICLKSVNSTWAFGLDAVLFLCSKNPQ